ncbi:unannotated protein [freshwater metagenome]|uniref:Unannotated protein n=1 Tax=freshwater metagenome TaxID=449393 RepID=A0A6J7KKP6_9ZZZZ|nr:hypothetical protein [Actinomycetota bacterium]
MADDRPADDVERDEPAGPCRACGAPTSTRQRYCLECGALVGRRRLEPLEVLRDRAGPAPAAAPPAPGRAVPMAAAAAAILVAGVSGALVTGGGEGARAAIVARAPVATTTPATVTATTPIDDAEAASPSPASADAGDEETAAADVPAEGPVADVPVADEGAAVPGDASGEPEPEPEAEPDDPAIEPHVWLLALEGPRAQEAVDRVAEQGVRLTGVAPVGTATIDNATTLLSGTPPPAPGAPAPDPAAVVPPSLPELLTTAGRTWRSYVDVQPGGTPALPGACTDPPPGDAAAAVLASRSPFGRIAALRTDDACTGGTFSLETLTDDVSSGETLPSFSYATLGGCAAPERSVVALPDQVSDTVTAITESTEFQENGVVVVTTVGATDPCPAPDAPAAPAPATTPGAAPAPAPTVVLRADAEPGTALDVATDLRALTRLTASTLGVDPPGTAGGDDVPALELPAAGD